MKKSFKILIIVFTFCLSNFLAPTVFAKADFPDSSKLQPTPTDVHPNISGNINSELGENNAIEKLQNSTEKILENLISPNYQNDNSNFGYLFRAVVFLIIAFVFFIVFIFVRKDNK
jgi:hypothetical protein